MSDLNDFKLGGYHNAGGYIRDGTGGERVRPMSDVQAFVDALELPLAFGSDFQTEGPDDIIGTHFDVWREESLRTFAVQAITAWQARPLSEWNEAIAAAAAEADEYPWRDPTENWVPAEDLASEEIATRIRRLKR